MAEVEVDREKATEMSSASRQNKSTRQMSALLHVYSRHGQSPRYLTIATRHATAVLVATLYAFTLEARLYCRSVRTQNHSVFTEYSLALKNVPACFGGVPACAMICRCIIRLSLKTIPSNILKTKQ